MGRFASIGKVGTPWSFLCGPQLRMRAPIFTICNKFSTRPQGTFLERSDVLNRVLASVKSNSNVDSSLVTEDSHFVNDLGVDSLDAVEIVTNLEDEFIIEIPGDDADKIHSVKDAVNYIVTCPNAH